MPSPTIKRAGVVAGACVLAGAAAGIAGSAAAPSHKAATTAQTGTTPAATAPARPAPGRGPGRGPWGPGHGPGGGPAVHSESVELDRAGKAFITVTRDAGTVESVSGDALAIDEAVGSVDYKTVTITVPSSATVVRNGATAKLSDLAAKDEVAITQSSDGSTIWAHDAQHERGGWDRHGGPGDPRGRDPRHP